MSRRNNSDSLCCSGFEVKRPLLPPHTHTQSPHPPHPRAADDDRRKPAAFQLPLLFAALQVVKERLLDLLSREEEEESHGEDVVRATLDPPPSPEPTGRGGWGIIESHITHPIRPDVKLMRGFM